MTSTWDFFISYANDDHDPEWAVWIADTLENAGYTTRLQAFDIGPGSNFVLDMDEFSKGSERLIMVLSPAYLSGRPNIDAEWSAKFVEDPAGKRRLLIPVMVRECEPRGLLGPRVYVKVFDKPEAAARAELLSALELPRTGPRKPAAFPGTVS